MAKLHRNLNLCWFQTNIRSRHFLHCRHLSDWKILANDITFFAPVKFLASKTQKLSTHIHCLQKFVLNSLRCSCHFFSVSRWNITACNFMNKIHALYRDITSCRVDIPAHLAQSSPTRNHVQISSLRDVQLSGALASPVARAIENTRGIHTVIRENGEISHYRWCRSLLEHRFS